MLIAQISGRGDEDVILHVECSAPQCLLSKRLPCSSLRVTLSLSRNRQMKMIVKVTRNAEKKPPAMPSMLAADSHQVRPTTGLRLHTGCSRRRRCCRAHPGVQKPICAVVLMVCGRSCRMSRTASSDQQQRNQEQQPDHKHGRPPHHRHRRRQPARHACLPHHEPHGVLEHESEEDPDEHDQECVADRPERRQHACCRSDQQHRSHRQEQRSHWRRADCRVIRSGHQDLGSVGATRRRSSGVIKWSLSTVGLLRADDPKPCKAYPTSLGLVESRRDNVPCRGDRSCGWTCCRGPTTRIGKDTMDDRMDMRDRGQDVFARGCVCQPFERHRLAPR